MEDGITFTAPTPFNLLCRLCGLSHGEVAAFAGVRPETVESWANGHYRPPDGLLRELVRLAAAIGRAAGSEQVTPPASGAT